MEEKSLAYEMLEELKRANERLERTNERLERTSNNNSKRWFIIAIVELVIIVSMAIGFLIYESQYDYATTTEEYTQETSNIDSSDVTQTIN